jgi:hypothetical protein
MEDYSSIIMRLVTNTRLLRGIKARLHAARLTSAFDIEPRVRAHEKGMKMAAEMYVLTHAMCEIRPMRSSHSVGSWPNLMHVVVKQL